MHEQENDRRLSRRRFIGGSAALGLGSAFLAACGDDSSSGGDAGSSSEGEEGSAPSGSGSGVAGSGDIPPVKIGFVTPRSGVLAAFGEADAFVLASLRDALVANVEILDRDAESDPAKAGEVAQELISEGIDIMLAGGTPDISVPVAAACDLSETVCLTTQAPWQPHYLGTGGALGPDQEPPVASEFNYHIFWGLEDVIEVFLGLWDQSGAAKVVGALWASSAADCPVRLDEYGCRLVHQISVLRPAPLGNVSAAEGNSRALPIVTTGGLKPCWRAWAW
jgi:hypothetical protein